MLPAGAGCAGDCAAWLAPLRAAPLRTVAHTTPTKVFIIAAA